jgi:isoleucyl-tRNA synthetase
MFNPVSSKVDFPALEREILAWWQENDILAKYLKRNEKAEKRHSFIDGPITANNPMAVHHAWGRTYKDLFLRYRTMQGFKQRYQNGFDGQGLWIEVEQEKELGFKSKLDIEAYGIDKFVEGCKERVRRFADTITEQSIRLGQWMDWDNSYHTMSDENNYTIWHFLKTCQQRGLLYEGNDVMPWCPRCSVGLTDAEVNEGYREIVHPGLYVRFPLLDREGESLLVWTTTPWTLTSNVAAAVHPEFAYVKVRTADEVLYLSKSRLTVLRGDHEVLEEMQGRELVGFRYRGPFDELPAQQGVEHRVVEWDEVNEVEGTGIVHTAPGAGKEDFGLGKSLGLPTIAPLDQFGVFTEGFGDLSGMSVFDVNEPIYESLRRKENLYHLEDYSHRYPVCWRCSTELVFRLVDEWFISMDELREPISDITRKIRWVPSFGLERELDWLRNMDDWMISKKRYYGLALPIYKCDCGHVDVIGSKAELQERAVEGWAQFEGHSPHRPWIDSVKIGCSECGATVSRIGDVGNPWLDAGIVPYSTLGYSEAEKSDYWREWFPADWISESFPGQFRNWFYSMLTLSTVLENKEPFRAVFSYALMRDEHGEEMHKSKGNAIWFEDAAERMGADSMRWLYSRQNPAANINFGYGTVDEVRRQFIIPLWNVYSFFVTYANIDQYDPSAPAPEVQSRPELDRWIISELNTLIGEVCDALDSYEPDRAARAAERFVEYLSNWYVRRSRRRFWKSGILGQSVDGADEDKLSAYTTLYECLVTLCKVLSPFMPFLTESMYQNLVRSQTPQQAEGKQDEREDSDERRLYESVHLDDYPQFDESAVDDGLSKATRLAMRLSSLGRAARSSAGIKVRQPLTEAVVSLPTQAERGYLAEIDAQLKDELNLKSVKDAGEAGGVFRYDVRPNFAALGPKYGPDVPSIVRQLAAMDAADVARSVESGDDIRLEDHTLLSSEVLVTRAPEEGYSVASEGGYTVAVSTEVTPELALEGLARELVHRIQNMRRSAEFDIADRIITYYQGGDGLNEVMEAHGGFIRQETLSRRLVDGPPGPEAYTEDHTIDGLDVTLGVVRD